MEQNEQNDDDQQYDEGRRKRARWMNQKVRGSIDYDTLGPYQFAIHSGSDSESDFKVGTGACNTATDLQYAQSMLDATIMYNDPGDGEDHLDCNFDIFYVFRFEPRG